jgi:BirA family biotin operon repressor/biotin-[acetyl-CoA-carboxylase] ligase
MKGSLVKIMINHQHLSECHSTQELLKVQMQELGSFAEHIISTDFQTAGIGRQGNNWVSFKGSLALSFTLPESKHLTLIPLEIGILICDFFKLKFNTSLKLKWPNDILNKNLEKAGGLIMHNLSHTIVVGLGLNLYNDKTFSNHEFIFKPGSVFSKIQDNEILPIDIYQFILSNRIENPEEVKSRWEEYCCHLNNEVKLIDGNEKVSGEFKGLGLNGEAIIDNNKFYSGSLVFGNN